MAMAGLDVDVASPSTLPQVPLLRESNAASSFVARFPLGQASEEGLGYILREQYVCEKGGCSTQCTLQTEKNSLYCKRYKKRRVRSRCQNNRPLQNSETSKFLPHCWTRMQVHLGELGYLRATHSSSAAAITDYILALLRATFASLRCSHSHLLSQPSAFASANTSTSTEFSLYDIPQRLPYARGRLGVGGQTSFKELLREASMLATFVAWELEKQTVIA